MILISRFTSSPPPLHVSREMSAPHLPPNTAEDLPRLQLNLRHPDTMAQGGTPVKQDEHVELTRWRALVEQVGREMSGPLTSALERVNNLLTSGKIDRAGLRALRDEVDQARQAGIWCQQIARLASGRVQASQERIQLTHTIQSVLAYRHRELEQHRITVQQRLVPTELQIDGSLLFSLLNSLVDWWITNTAGPVELSVDRTSWPERARLQCALPLKTQDNAPSAPVANNLHWFVLEQTAKTLGLTIDRQDTPSQLRLRIEFPHTIPADLPTLLDEAYSPSVQDSHNSKPLAGCHVLVIASQRSVRIQVREALKTMGLILDFVSNLREASEFCREGLPHAIVFEDGLQTAAFQKLADDIRRQVPEFVFVELIRNSRQFDISSVSATGMARVGSEVIDANLPSALIYELTRVI